MFNRRDFVGSAAALAALGTTRLASAQAYPTQPVRWIAPFGAGGPSDVIARHAAELMTESLGKPIVIENKPGAGGAIATAEVARSKADGYTLGVATTDTLIAPVFLLKSPGYDSRTDITLISKLCVSQPVLVARSSLNVNNVRDLIAAAKAQPKPLSYAHWGQGSLPHLYLETLKSLSGIELIDVPYRGGAQALQDLVSGQIDIMLLNAGLVAQYEQKGLVTVIAVSGHGSRLPQFPKAATMQEQRFDAPIFKIDYWTGLVGPRGLPPAVVKRWTSLAMDLKDSPEFKASMEGMGMVAYASPPEVFEADMKWEFENLGALIKKLGIKPV